MSSRKKLLFITILASAVLFVAACSSPQPAAVAPTSAPQPTSAPAPKFPTGKFVSVEDNTVAMLFKEDGTWEYIHYVTAAQGTYSIEGNLYTDTTKDNKDCPFPATYEWTFDGKNLSFKLVGEDKCDPRREATDGKAFTLTP